MESEFAQVTQRRTGPGVQYPLVPLLCTSTGVQYAQGRRNAAHRMALAGGKVQAAERSMVLAAASNMPQAVTHGMTQVEEHGIGLVVTVEWHVGGMHQCAGGGARYGGHV